ncbi:MAG: hypothetical protein IPK82_25060 [Polyangiaceae bacterium]|nr:hypothetical protein [Polyangiaceae bacterium]
MKHVVLLSMAIVVAGCGNSASGSASGAPVSSGQPSSSASAASAVTPPGPATGPVLSSPLPAGVAKGANGTGRATLKAQLIHGSSRWIVLGGDVIHLCEWKPGASFTCTQVEGKLPAADPEPTVTLSADPPFLIVDSTTYDKRGTFDSKGNGVSTFYDRGATRFADGALVINNADNLIRYATPGKGAKTSPFVYPKEMGATELFADVLLYQRDDQKGGLFARALKGPTEPLADETKVGDLGDIERLGFAAGCFSQDEKVVFLSETLKDYSLGRGVFVTKKGDKWSTPVILKEKLPTYIRGENVTCGSGTFSWANAFTGPVHHLKCTQSGCTLTAVEGIVPEGALAYGSVPVGDQVAVVVAENGAENKRQFVLRMGLPSTLAASPKRVIGVFEKGGVDDVRLVAGKEAALLLVRVYNSASWVAYELDSAGRTRVLTP